MKIISLVVAAGLLLFAQTASVTILDPIDTIIVRTAYQNLTEAQQVWNEAHARIKKKYKITGDIEFSHDFKAFIPKIAGVWTCSSGNTCAVGISHP